MGALVVFTIQSVKRLHQLGRAGTSGEYLSDRMVVNWAKNPTDFLTVHAPHAWGRSAKGRPSRYQDSPRIRTQALPSGSVAHELDAHSRTGFSQSDPIRSESGCPWQDLR